MDGNLRRLVLAIARAVLYLLNARQDTLLRNSLYAENKDVDALYRTIQNEMDNLNNI